MTDGSTPEEILASHNDAPEMAMQFLDDFERKGWPIFERRGYSRDAAMIAWFLHWLRSDMCDLEDAVDELKEALGRG